MIYLSNAFSLQMSGGNTTSTEPVGVEEVRRECVTHTRPSYNDEGGSALTAKSIVGHADIAKIISGLLNCTVPVNRQSICMEFGDVLYVGQYVGPRLPEGCTTIPEGAKIEWYKVLCGETPAKGKENLAAAILRQQDDQKRKWNILGIAPERASEFLQNEDSAFCGFGDEKGRDAIAKELGVSRKILDMLL